MVTDGHSMTVTSEDMSLLMNSGASTNFIRRDLVPSNLCIESPPLSISIANGTIITSDTFTVIKILLIKHLYNNVSTVLYNAHFVILDPIPTDIILGMRTIRENRLVDTFREHWVARPAVMSYHI